MASPKSSCSIPDCNQPSHARGWCGTHYAYQRRHGLALRPRGRRACTVSDCEQPRMGEGYCQKHWRRWKKYGSPYTLKVRRDLPANERFWLKVDRRGPDDCWEWLAGKNVWGYGKFNVNRRTLGAHRYAYELIVGPIPDGLTLDHLCRNRACVNPAHLEPVTNHENILRGTSPVAEAARKTHCLNGHPLDLVNTKFQPDGHRNCRTCAREYARNYGRGTR